MKAKRLIRMKKAPMIRYGGELTYHVEDHESGRTLLSAVPLGYIEERYDPKKHIYVSNKGELQ